MDKLTWCFGLKDGLKVVEPNEVLAKSYLTEAKSSLERAQKNFQDNDLLWTSVVIYYAEYYALYAFMQAIGTKCENHFCSILAVTEMLGSEKTDTINRHKDKRIDAQYYMKVGKENEVGTMLQEAKTFIAEFDNIVSNLTEQERETYRSKLKRFS